MRILASTKKFHTYLLVILSIAIFSATNFPQVTDNADVYTKLKAFSLNNGKTEVSNLVLKRDRVTMTFTGTFYFAERVKNKVTGAVFIGKGNLKADTPTSDFEKNNIKRLLGAESINANFKRAVLRFTDDTFSIIGKGSAEAKGDEKIQKIANAADARISEETGANIPARLALSIINDEKSGVFIGSFSGGKRKFKYIFDPQSRIPTAFFTINGGEKGLIYSYDSSFKSSEVWTAFYSLQDYQSKKVAYSDLNDLVDIEHYKMIVDVRKPKTSLKLHAKVRMKSRASNLTAIPFLIGESLGEYKNQRLKKQMRIKSVKMNGKNLSAVQEDWDSQILVFLPNAVGKDEKFELEFELEGDFMRQSSVNHTHYPRSNTSWYPRHGYLDRSTFDFTYFHPQKLRVASVGVRKSEGPNLEDKNGSITRYEMTYPVALVTFAMGPFETHKDTIKWDKGGKPIPVEFNSLPGAYQRIKESFILAELSNSVRYFHEIFGRYPYDTYSATFHPFGFGQGFPSMLMIPAADNANKHTFAFISHETAHQWWGNIVAWRSYRDQWLSEGFAEYSGVLYTQQRENAKTAYSLIKSMRKSLKSPPRTLVGLGKGRLNDVGPIILGHRLNTNKTRGAYQTLIYNKGALVLRMIHFLLTNPSNGDDKAFYEMMKDFVEKHRNGVASTDDFRRVVNAHFIKTPIARKYQLKNIDWFFDQWVYHSELPSYKLEYSYEKQKNGGVIVKGNVFQEGVPKNWFMPLPITFKLGSNQFANGTVYAYGPKTPFEIKLPVKPVKIEFDPHNWVLSSKTSVK